MQKSIFYIVFMVLLVSTISCRKESDPAAPPSNTTPEELTATLENIYQQSDAPGFSLSVIKNDAIVYQHAFGMADIATGQAYTDQTIQPIGSISKTFVAAAVVKAIEQGYFTLETDINEVLPFEVINPNQPTAVIRVKHLVTHTSGLLDNDAVYLRAYHILPGEDLSTTGAQLFQTILDAQQREALSLADFLAAYYLPAGDLYDTANFADTAPGSNWAYSNIATSLTAYLVETAVQMPFSDYVDTYIFTPLGMHQTAYESTGLNPNHLATLYWDANTPFPAYGNDSYPDGSVQTSNEDLAKYLLDMMRGVRGQSTTLFSAAGYELLFDALLPDGMLPASLGNNQSLFWFLDDQLIRHDGSDPGTTCNLQFTASGDTGYLLLTNMDASTVEHESAWASLAGQVEQAINQFLRVN
jgi:CubicO group peptidase (beta-lactamase class C family)